MYIDKNKNSNENVVKKKKERETYPLTTKLDHVMGKTRRWRT